ncbi:MAG TPA: hypothetical protein VNZ01_07045 [Solirubrobacteraceae bacterium]|jgi:hypothetical protein|nr:hypothetical protein [Solirubrobacteraceae bacterium]
MTLESTEMADDRHRDGPRRGWLLTFVRYVLPGAVVVAGLVVMSLGGESDLEGGAGIVGAGLAIFFLNWLFRAGASGEREREAEEAARDYLDRHGHWPD